MFGEAPHGRVQRRLGRLVILYWDEHSTASSAIPSDLIDLDGSDGTI